MVILSQNKEELIGLKYKKDKEFPDWYTELVIKSQLAEYAPVKGCMTIRPLGYAIWENIQKEFDAMIKESGHQNAYFPFFIPERFLKKEAEHFEGFSPELAYVATGNKEEDKGEKYILRPTSETIIYDTFSRWIRSWRDLPLKINQWCNIVRWETKVTRLFLRTKEFLWQEGHTAHATSEEAAEEAMYISGLYRKIMEEYLAIPICIGKKSESEKFPGAFYTITHEALMPSGRALQMGTSHHLGQNFSRPFGIRFRDKDEKEKYVWQTSWGITTRLIGALVMVHGDNKGLVLPPNIAPVQVVVIPIIFEKGKKEILKKAESIAKKLDRFRVQADLRDEYSAGWKFNEWEMKGVPIRMEVGPTDIKKKQVILVRRDTGEKIPTKETKLLKTAEKILEDIQKNMFARARKFLKDNTKDAKSYDDLRKLIKEGKMVRTNWCGDTGCENKISEELAATIRFIPFKKEKPFGKCVACGNKTKEVVYIAKAY